MLNFERLLYLKIISLVVAPSLFLNSTVYGVDLSDTSHLRVPLSGGNVILEKGKFHKTEVESNATQPSFITIYRGADHLRHMYKGEFTEAESDAGQGSYFVGNIHSAIIYAYLNRSCNKSLSRTRERYVYETKIDISHFLDFEPMDLAAKQQLAKEYLALLKEKETTNEIPWYKKMCIKELEDKITRGKRFNLQDLARNFPKLFTQFCEGKGYKGILFTQGSENNGRAFKHAKFVVFPTYAKTVRPTKVYRFNVTTDMVRRVESENNYAALGDVNLTIVLETTGLGDKVQFVKEYRRGI